MPYTTRLVSCRLSESDFEALRSHAESLELNQSDYLRHLIRIPVNDSGLATGEQLVSLDTKPFGRIYSELVRWGRHYNQAVRALNTIAMFVRNKGAVDPQLAKEQLGKATTELELVQGSVEEIKGMVREVSDSERFWR